jgi:hypothetical protein
MYRSVEILHEVVFCLTIGLQAAFVGLMLRPFLRSLENERRHLAELFSQLPTEVCCVIQLVRLLVLL